MYQWIKIVRANQTRVVELSFMDTVKMRREFIIEMQSYGWRITDIG